MNLALNMYLMRNQLLNTRQFKELNTFLKKRRSLTTTLLSIKLNTFLKSIKTNTLSTSLKKDSRRELNTKLFKSRSSTNLFNKFNRQSRQSNSQSFRLLKSALFKLFLLFNNKLFNMFRLFLLFNNKLSNMFRLFLFSNRLSSTSKFLNSRFNTYLKVLPTLPLDSSDQFHTKSSKKLSRRIKLPKPERFKRIFYHERPIERFQ